MGNVLIYADQRAGKFRKPAFEAVRKGKELAGALGGQAVAVVIGSDVSGIAPTLAHYGADKVITAEDASLELFSIEGYAGVFAEIAKSENPDAVIVPGTIAGKDVAAGLAARIGVAVAMDCVGLEIKDGTFEVVRPVYAGKTRVTMRMTCKPNIISIRPKAFAAGDPDESLTAEVVKYEGSPVGLRCCPSRISFS